MAKTRKQKRDEYQEKFGHIPIDFNERLSYMYDLYKFDKYPEKLNQLISKRDNMLMNLRYYDLNVVSLYELPEGTGRPRFRLINRQNFHVEAINNPSFVHVYVVGAAEDNLHMKRMVDDELMMLDGLISTPVIIEYNCYFKTPTYFNDIDTCLAEAGIIRPSMKKPDFDNIGKKYADMYNYNIWLDDSTVNTGTVNKFYSILPRIEIKLRYLNCVYNKQQYDTITKRKDYDRSIPLSYLDKNGNMIIP